MTPGRWVREAHPGRERSPTNAGGPFTRHDDHLSGQESQHTIPSLDLAAKERATTKVTSSGLF